VVAALVVRDESLGAVLLPLHRTRKLAARPHHQRLLRIDEGLHAKRTADIGRDQSEHLLRDLEHCLSERITNEMRTLRRRIESRAAACRIEVGNGVARLHRVDNHAIVDQFERDSARGPRECRLGRLGVAHVIVPVEDDVAGNVVEKLRRTGPGCILSLGYCWQRLVLDIDRFSGITGSGQTVGYDQRDWLTHVSHLAERKHGTGCVVPRRTVTRDQRNHAGHVAEAICPNVLSSSHKQDVRHAARRGYVDALDMRVRHGRAHHEGMRHSR
jgi:hypothetical protein